MTKQIIKILKSWAQITFVMMKNDENKVWNHQKIASKFGHLTKVSKQKNKPSLLVEKNLDQ